MAGPQFEGPSAREIGDMLRERTEDLVAMIFPNAVRASGYLCVGSVHGEAGDSLKIRISGPKRGTWADYACSPQDPNGTGDMLKLLQLTVGGGDMKRGVAEAKRFLNLDTMDPRALERQREATRKAQARREREKLQDDERKRHNAQGLWLAGSPLTPSSPPVRYLLGRGIDFAEFGRKLPGAIRFHPKVRHAEMSELRGDDVLLPAMVTKYQLLDGRHAATHVTYLDFHEGGWRKLPDVVMEKMDKETGELLTKPVRCSKKTFSPLYWGAHIPLWKGARDCPLWDIPEATPVFVSEGIEDGYSYAMAHPQARVIAAGTQGNIGQMALPPQAGDLVLLAQNDTKQQAIEALEDVVRQQQAQAARQGSSRAVLQKRPPREFKDWNDWLQGEKV